MNNQDVARVLEQLATMLEIDGANPFRVRAYREGGRIVGSLPQPVATLAAEAGALEALKGIGKDLAQKIRDLVASGSTELFDELKLRIPLEVVALTELQGLGPKRVQTLMTELKVKDRATLEAAAKAGKLRDLPGFGEKVEQNVLKALATAEQSSGRMLMAGAWGVAHELLARVKAVKGVHHAELAGSFRRRRETIGDLDVLATGGRAETVMEVFVTHPDVVDVLGRGDTKSSVRLRNGLQVDLRHVPDASFGAALLYFTGSKAHNIELRKRAIDKGWSLNEYGLTKGERTIAGRTEEEIYQALGLAWIPPELRESNGELELAAAGKLPKLIELDDIRGDLHMHSTRSDGKDTLEAMVKAARDRGLEYVAITEHSKVLPMTRGFDDARVAKSVAEIEAVRRAVPGIEVLHGLEVDILGDGSLDLGDEALGLLDWVVISLHTRLGMERDEMTSRVLRALDHPAVAAMGHPTARRIGQRDAVAIDLDAVFERAAARGVAMELSAQPDRTDLDDVNARRAAALGCSFVIDTDAHATSQLELMRYGVFTARRAGLSKNAILNTMPFAKLEERLAKRRTATPGKGVAPSKLAVPKAAKSKAGKPKAAGRAKSAAPTRKRSAK
ncbi:MAG: DNA polymerase/3'-5' exonuclease PolX [Candidatus Eisenbacteria bacterium]|uniref:DNA polymerase beta n=1 Tax=Eiseniibacteriota bacterium TaxID=2212470 RepID=A0A849SPL7_UNCEI|nr:DNA polymerase/3'-5' exonuclease PolX [Candidatus Eisenbacteria bacterium]